MANHDKCELCGNKLAIFEDGICYACEQDASDRAFGISTNDEPIDEGLAYQDRLDGWHGPHHG